MTPIYPYPTQTYEAHFNEYYHDRMNEFAALQPAYQFGHDLYYRLANSSKPDEVELMIWREKWAQEEWEKSEDNETVWDDVKDAVVYGWEQALELFSAEDNDHTDK